MQIGCWCFFIALITSVSAVYGLTEESYLIPDDQSTHSGVHDVYELDYTAEDDASEFDRFKSPSTPAVNRQRYRQLRPDTQINLPENQERRTY